MVPGVEPKRIEEYIGRVNTDTEALSVAVMVAPGGWTEPGQRPDFDEVTVVMTGTVRVEHENGSDEVAAGQAVIVRSGEWVRHSTPYDDGAQYVSVCSPAFAPYLANRDVT